MKVAHTVLLSMLAGTAIGAGVIHGVHAQSKPPVYAVSEINVTNLEGYTKEFAPVAAPIVKAHGGRVLAAGQPTLIAGEPQEARMVVVVWDSMEQLQAWFNSPEYQKARRIGEQHAKFRTYAVPGVTPQ